MIPRGVVVAGGFAVVAGGAVYVFQPEASPEPSVPPVDPNVRWVMDGADPGTPRHETPLAIRDPLSVQAIVGDAATFARNASVVESLEPFEGAGSSLRPAFVPDPELPSRFAAPASASFVAGTSSGAARATLAPLGGPRQDRLPLEAASTSPSPASVAATGAARPVAIGRHKIQDGETLEQIAERNYGDPALAAFLFESNRRLLDYPDLLPVGKEIVIYAPPTDAPRGEVLASSSVPRVVAPKAVLPNVRQPELAPLE